MNTKKIDEITDLIVADLFEFQNVVVKDYVKSVLKCDVEKAYWQGRDDHAKLVDEIRGTSNCCDSKPVIPESDVCSKCGEHAEILTTNKE